MVNSVKDVKRESLLFVSTCSLCSFFVFLQDVCMVVYTKDKLAKCRTPLLELLIKVNPFE